MREETGQQPNYGMVLEKRAKAMLTGVTEVESFDDGQVVLSTHGGRLVITGAGLHVSSLVLEEGKLSAGHARALLPLPEKQQEPAAKAVLSGALSVRQTEALVKRVLAEDKPAKKETKPADAVDYTAEAQKSLARALGRGVRIVQGRKKGRIELEYYGLDDLNGLLDALAALRVEKKP